MRGDFFPNGIAADSGFAVTDKLAVDDSGIIVVPHAGLSNHLRGGDDERQMSFLLGQERAADQSGPRSRSGRGDRTLDAMLRL